MDKKYPILDSVSDMHPKLRQEVEYYGDKADPVRAQPTLGPVGPLIVETYLGRDFMFYLRDVSFLTISQKLELGEILTGFETRNRYEIKNQDGQIVFQVHEKSHWLPRNCLGNRRAFNLKLMNTREEEIISIERPVNCSLLCGWLCHDKLVVKANGMTLGSITQNPSIFTPSLTLRDASNKPVFKLKGPCWPCLTCSWLCACNSVDFELISCTTGTSVGRISKNWSGVWRELFTDSDKYGIMFPMDLDIPMKAVCLAALYMIDFQYFEHAKCSIKACCIMPWWFPGSLI